MPDSITFLDIVFHIDRLFVPLLNKYGAFFYLLIFAIIFCETGLVVTPFLPGDSLLFGLGAFAATGAMDLYLVTALTIGAAFFGNLLNYAIGRAVGPSIFSAQKVRFLKRENLDKAHAFYVRNGSAAVFIARFIPIIRTFVPFIAGIARMPFKRYLAITALGAATWVLLFVMLGYFLGGTSFVKQNFSIIVLAIIVISLVPAVVTAIRARRTSSHARQKSSKADR